MGKDRMSEDEHRLPLKKRTVKAVGEPSYGTDQSGAPDTGHDGPFSYDTDTLSNSISSVLRRNWPAGMAVGEPSYGTDQSGAPDTGHDGPFTYNTDTLSNSISSILRRNWPAGMTMYELWASLRKNRASRDTHAGSNCSSQALQTSVPPVAESSLKRDRPCDEDELEMFFQDWRSIDNHDGHYDSKRARINSLPHSPEASSPKDSSYYPYERKQWESLGRISQERTFNGLLMKGPSCSSQSPNSSVPHTPGTLSPQDPSYYSGERNPWEQLDRLCQSRKSNATHNSPDFSRQSPNATVLHSLRTMSPKDHPSFRETMDRIEKSSASGRYCRNMIHNTSLAHSPETMSPKDTLCHSPGMTMDRNHQKWTCTAMYNSPSCSNQSWNTSHPPTPEARSPKAPSFLSARRPQPLDLTTSSNPMTMDRNHQKWSPDAMYNSPSCSNQSPNTSLPPTPEARSPKPSSCNSVRMAMDRNHQKWSPDAMYNSPSCSNQSPNTSLPPTPEARSPKPSSCNSVRMTDNDSRSTSPDSNVELRTESPDMDYGCNIPLLPEVDAGEDYASGSGKRRTKSRKPTKYGNCKVCGRPASGNHYHVLSCEGCKGFWRRVIQNEHEGNSKIYVCKGGEGRCRLDGVETENLCPCCRREACQRVGMKKELVMDRPTREAHNAKKENNRRKRRAEEEKRVTVSDAQRTFSANCQALAQCVQAAFHKSKEVAGQSSEERLVTAEEFQQDCDQHDDVFFHLRSDLRFCLTFSLWLHDHVALSVKQNGQVGCFEEGSVYMKVLAQLPDLFGRHILYTYRATDCSLCFGNKRLSLAEMQRLPPQTKNAYERFFERCGDIHWLDSCQHVMDQSVLALQLAKDVLTCTTAHIGALEGNQDKAKAEERREASQKVAAIQEWYDPLTVHINDYLRCAIKAKDKSAGLKCFLALLIGSGLVSTTKGPFLKAVLPTMMEEIEQHHAILKQRADYVSLPVCEDLDISRSDHEKEQR